MGDPWTHASYAAVYLPVALWAEDTRWKAVSLLVAPAVARKWRRDCGSLPLTPAHRELYRTIHVNSWVRLREFPDLVHCRDFNDRVQWLKLFDQTREVVTCCDKLRFRQFVEQRVCSRYLVDLYQASDHFSELDFAALPQRFVLKTNHDSGTVQVVRDKSQLDLVASERLIKQSLVSTYGWRQGEWGYAYVKPKVFAEQFIESEGPAPPPDYKFYCVDGKVRFLHYIYDRGFDTKQQLLDPEGNDLHTPLSSHFKPGTGFVRPSRWEELKEVAEKLSAGFKCVRVDLYCTEDRVYAGEMTFWPLAGHYKGEGQVRLGQLLDFDRTTYKPLLLPVLDAELGRR